MTSPLVEMCRSLIPGYDPWTTGRPADVASGDSVGDVKPDGLWFDEDRAQFSIDFIEQCCTHVKGSEAGKPLKLEPWAKAFIGNLFGWKRSNGTRRYREAFLYVPRGNAKTTYAAAIVNLVAFTDNEPGAELYSAAAEQKQAKLCFDIVAGMIRNDSELSKRAEIFKQGITIGDASYKALTAKAGSKHGQNVHLAVIDELHAHETPELVEVLMTGAGKRRQPLVVHLTTADYERESICNSKYGYACRVRDGIVDDPAFLPVIFEASVDDDWTDPKVWAKANPNLGTAVPVEYIERECKRAQDDPNYLNTFLRLHLNVKTQSNVACIDLKKWDACDEIRPPYELEGRTCYGGLDLSSKTDVTAFVLCFPDAGAYDFLCWFWIPEETVHSREIDKRKYSSSYQAWAREGLVEMVPGTRIETDLIEAKVLELAKQYNLIEVAYDPWNCETVRQHLDAAGIRMVEFTQGLRNFTEPMKEYLSLILEGKIRHGGNKVLRWMAGNLNAYHDANDNIRPVKSDGGEKIDGQVAAIMALARALFNQDDGRSVYETPGSLML